MESQINRTASPFRFWQYTLNILYNCIMDTKIGFNEARGRYEMLVEGHTVFANARREGSTLYIDYVEAPMALRGKGAASALMHEILEIARAEELAIVPICGYAAEWLRRHSNDYSPD